MHWWISFNVMFSIMTWYDKHIIALHADMYSNVDYNLVNKRDLSLISTFCSAYHKFCSSGIIKSAYFADNLILTLGHNLSGICCTFLFVMFWSQLSYFFGNLGKLYNSQFQFLK